MTLVNTLIILIPLAVVQYTLGWLAGYLYRTRGNGIRWIEKYVSWTRGESS